MQSNKRKNKAARQGGETREPRPRSDKSPSQGGSPGPKSQQYTARQREQMLKGLRILAKVIVRAHLRRQAELPDTE